MDILEAHRQEIWEGIMHASLRVNVGDFQAFRTEWERLEEQFPDEGRKPIMFNGDPQRYEIEAYCGHCDSVYSGEGVSSDPSMDQ